MTRSIRMAWLAAFLFWPCLIHPHAVVGQPAEEASRLRALVIAETSDLSIGDSVAKDARNMEQLLKEGFKNHEDHLKLTVLTGDQVSSISLAEYFKNLDPDPTETLLFFFAGHGVIDAKTGEHHI